MVMLIMALFFHEKYRWHMGLAVLLAFSGVALLSFGGGSGHDSSESPLIGITLSLTAGLRAVSGFLIANKAASLLASRSCCMD